MLILHSPMLTLSTPASQAVVIIHSSSLVNSKSGGTLDVPRVVQKNACAIQPDGHATAPPVGPVR